MNRKRLRSLVAVLAISILHGFAHADGHCCAPIVIHVPLDTLAASSAAAGRSVPRPLVVCAGIGVLSPRADPVHLASLGEELSNLHLAAAVLMTVDFLSESVLSLAWAGEVWWTFGSYRESDLETVPILLGVQASLFPSSPVRLYGTVGAGPCISRLSQSGWVDSPQWPFFPVYETSEEHDCSIVCAAGGGMQLGRRRRFFGIDYRYLMAGSDPKLGGHLLCISVGFLLR